MAEQRLPVQIMPPEAVTEPPVNPEPEPNPNPMPSLPQVQPEQTGN
jgi:hypothetical protein